MDYQGAAPGPADVEYFTRAQAGAWGETLRAFARFLGSVAGYRVLDVGSGPGLLPRLCAANDTNGLGAALALACDDSWPMAQQAASQSSGVPAVAVVAGAALRLPFASAALDAVLATNLLFLLPDPAEGLAEMVRVARPGGLVAFLNPSRAMNRAAATAFADGRGMQGFARFSFINYGRLAEEHAALAADAWIDLARLVGLVEVRSETRAGGLIVFVAGHKPH